MAKTKSKTGRPRSSKRTQKKSASNNGNNNGNKNAQEPLQTAKAHDSTVKEFLHVLSTPYAGSTPKLRDDFYNYINYEWIDKKNTELKTGGKKYFVQVDSFRETQDKVFQEIIDIVKEYTRESSTQQATSMKNLYTSMLHLNPGEAERYAVIYRGEVDEIMRNGGLYDLLGAINQNEVVSWGSPLVWSVLHEPSNAKMYKATISAPELTLYDYTLYIEDTEDDQNTVESV